MSRQPRVPLASVLLALLLISLTMAQIIPSDLPACVQQCTLVLQAQGSCESNPSAANTCFCQSTLITALKSPSDNICAPACSAADYTTISNWYNQLCANGGTNTPTVTTITTSVTSPAAAATSTAASSSQETEINQNQTGQEWWSTHWQWIIMVIVLVVAFLVIGFGGRWLYRRHQRKKDGIETGGSSTAVRGPDMGMWAPSQRNVHDFGPPNPADGQPGSSMAQSPPAMSGAAGAVTSPRGHNGKGKARLEEPSGPMRGGSKRLRKAANAFQM